MLVNLSPGRGDRSWRLRCALLRGAFFTKRATAAGSSPGCSSVSPGLSSTRRKSVSRSTQRAASVQLGEPHHLTHRRPPMRDLFQGSVQQAFQSPFLVTVYVPPEHPRMHPPSPVPLPPASASSPAILHMPPRTSPANTPVAIPSAASSAPIRDESEPDRSFATTPDRLLVPYITAPAGLELSEANG